MKWALYAGLLAGVAVCVAAAILVSTVATPSGYAAYGALDRAQAGLPATQSALEALATRQDAAGWQARLLV
ncbi:MAG: hypothetical protein PHU43_07525, partial [Candidatus Bipolaricaulis sp.]|nr:hypothetical protein [Candidatus Bipolaricaulis sp.]